MTPAPGARMEPPEGLEASRQLRRRPRRSWRHVARTEDSDEPAAEDLVRTHIDGIDPGWTIDEDSGGVVAIGPDQVIIAVLIAAGMKMQGGLLGFIRHLVVADNWRGQGVGAVTLGVAHQVFPVDQEPFMYIGECAARSARFYQRVGYTVLQPGEPLLLPGAASARPQTSTIRAGCTASGDRLHSQSNGRT